MDNYGGLIYSNFIRYEQLTEIFANSCSTSKYIGKPIEIYIDIDSLYGDYFTTTGLGYVYNDPIYLSSTLMNLIGHYRHFAKRTLKCDDITIYLMIPPVYDVFNLAEKICQYIPNIYILRDKLLDNNPIGVATALALHVSMQTIHSPNTNRLYITREKEMPFQLPAINNSWEVLYITKINTHSRLVNNENCLDQWKSSARTYFCGADPALLPLFMAYTSFKRAYIYTMYDIANAGRLIANHVRNFEVFNGYNHPDSIKQILDKDTLDTTKVTRANRDGVSGIMPLYDRYKVCDLLTRLNIYQTNTAFGQDNRWKIKKYADYKVVADVCDKYFNSSNNPVNIQFLYWG